MLLILLSSPPPVYWQRSRRRDLLLNRRWTVTPTVVSVGGLTNYAYNLTDTGSETIGEFDLGVPDSAALTNITAPAGWLTLYTTGYAIISFDSTDSSTDIAPGTLLAGFSFTSPLTAGEVDYAAVSFDTGDAATGTTLAPAVPEPASCSLFAFGIIGFLVYRNRSALLGLPAFAKGVGRTNEIR